MQGGGYGGYGKRYSIKPRFYLILVLLLGLAIWAIVALSNAFATPKIEWGRLSSDQAISAVVLRDEQIVPAPEYGRLSCVAAEGEAVAKDAPVATLFLSGYSDKDNSSLLKLQNDIKDHQKNHIIKDTVYKDLDTINGKIDAKMNEISAAVIANKTEGLAAAEQELKSYMDERKQYMYTITSDKKDETLERMTELEKTLQEKVNQTRKDITAPADGLVSFYLDGYETELTVNGINDMTPNKMKALKDKLLGSGQAFESADIIAAGKPICRIVNPAKWYAIVVMNTRENRFVQGAGCEVTFDGVQETVTAKVLKVLTDGGTSLAVLEVPKGVKEMISMRLVTGHLGQDIEGFRVPRNMITEENGKAYIRLQGAGADRTEVNILGKDDRYVIIEQANGGGDLSIGRPLVKP